MWRMTEGYGPDAFRDVGWGDPKAALDAVMGQAAGAASARRELAEVTGQAESPNGLLRAVADGGGLRELAIDPRAMRMPSVDLAAGIVAVAREAAVDLGRRREERLRELGVDRAPVDLEQSLERLHELRAMVEAGQGDMRAVFERFRGRTAQ